MRTLHKRMVYPIILIILAIFFFAGCAQPGLLAATPVVLSSAPPDFPFKASPAQTEAPLPTKASPQLPEVTATPYLAGQIFDLAYASQLWLLVGLYENTSDQSTAVNLILHGSTDGGQSWEAHPLPASVIQSGDFRARRVAFLDQSTGWAYGPGLFETRDGGRSWKEIRTDEDVAAIVPAPDPGGKTWVLEDTCPASGGNCTYRLLSLDPQAGTLSPLSEYGNLSAHKDAAMIRVGERTAYVLAAYFPGQDQYPFYAMWVSDGSGSGWKKLTIPNCEVAAFSLSPDGIFWLLCGDGLGAGSQPKAIYVSSDQGKTWELRSANGPGTWSSSPTPSSASPLVLSGYISDLLALSKDEALVGLSRDTLHLSTDGGREWKEAIPLTASSTEEFLSWWLVRKPGSDELWAAASGWPSPGLLFYSTDRGQSWNQINTFKP